MRYGWVAVWLVAPAGAAMQAPAWTPEYNLTPAYAGAGAPNIAVGPSGRVHVVYAALRSGEQLRYYYRWYTPVSGWSAQQDLPGPNYKEPECHMAVDGSEHIHVVGIYRLNGDGPYTVHYWEYDGFSWSGPVQLSSGTHGDATACKIAVDRFGDLHVVWAEDGMTGGESDVMYRKRQAGTWQATKNVTSNSAGTSYGSVSPWVAVDANGANVHVVWHDDFLNNGFQAYYTKNTNLGDPGAWWSSAQWFQISTGDYGKAPRVYLDRYDNPSVFWFDRFGGSENRQAYRRWTGSAWTAPANWGVQWCQGVAFDQNNLMRYLYTAEDAGGATELYYRTYDFTNFSAPELVSTGADTMKADIGALALDAGGYPHALWEERKGAWPGTGYIFYSTKTPMGAPPPVTSFAVSSSCGVNRLSWVNPVAINFSGTMIRCSTDHYPLNQYDGVFLYDHNSGGGQPDNYAHTGLADGVTYYYTAFTHDDGSLFGEGRTASGAPWDMTTAYAERSIPDGAVIDLCGKRVTALFPADSCIYVEDRSGASGMRVLWSGGGLAVGDVVNLTGAMATRTLSGYPSERQLNASAVVKVSSPNEPVAPCAMKCSSVGGAAAGLAPGVRDGSGANNMGLLVTIAGAITDIISTSIYVDDGSNVTDISGRIGVMVRYPSLDIPFEIGDIVSATGVVEGSIPTGWTINRRCIRARTAEDVRRIQ